jgi:hypothetical protein
MKSVKFDFHIFPSIPLPLSWGRVGVGVGVKRYGSSSSPFPLPFIPVLSKVISPLPLGERVRVRGKKDFSDGLQNTF